MIPCTMSLVATVQIGEREKSHKAMTCSTLLNFVPELTENTVHDDGL
jgi:hypothetical protein